MALQVILAFVGLLIGAMLMESGGWILGAVLGFLVASVLQMSNTIKEQTKKIQLLESMQEYLHLSLKALQPDTNKTAAPGQSVVNVQENNNGQHALLEVAPLMPTPPEEVFDLSIPDDLTQSHATNDKPINISSIKENPINEHAGPDKKIPVNRQPDVADKVVEGIKNFFLKGNPVVRVGMVVLFFGLSFFVKYAAAQGYFPIELRLSFVALIAMGLIVIGWKTRERAGGYGLVLQGGGLAALYLTCFAAAKMYELMPSTVALFLLLVFVIFGVILALLQNAQVLAIMAIAGGFIAPILTSDGSNNYVGLFSIYLILNIGVLLLGWFRTWRLLNWIGFIFTFVITTYWGVLRYEPQFYLSTQPFLIAFFLMYLTISILFSLKQPADLKGLVDGSLVFGLPIVGFGLQVALLKHTEYGVAISSLILACIYIGLARWLWIKYLQTQRVLAESFLALGVGFATLAIPLGLNADWTSATWAFEAAGLLWVGLRQSRLLPRAAAVLLYFAACFASLIDPLHSGQIPIIQGDFIGMFILAFAGLLMAFHYFTYANVVGSLEKLISNFLVLVGLAWWISALILELDGHLTQANMFAAFYIALAVCSLLQYAIANRFNWPQLAYYNYFYFVVIVFWSLFGIVDDIIDYPTDSFFAAPFIIYIGAQYFLFFKMERHQWKSGLEAMHLLSGLWILLLLLWQTSGLIHQGVFLDWMLPGTAKLAVSFIVFSPALLCLLLLNKKFLWPASSWKSIYQNWIPAPYLILLTVWFLMALGDSGIIGNFYMPFINPADIAQFAVILLFGFAFKHNLSFTHELTHLFKQVVLGILIFVWVNLVLVRSLHYFLVIPYEFDSLWHSAVVQMSLSILWTLCALLCMNVARRIQVRNLWIAGAALLGLVLLKLFTTDLSDSGTLARVVSFMVVGGLILVIGYLSPIPPRESPGQKSGEKP